MEYGLSENTIEEIRAVFRRFPQIRSVRLFGSRAMGNYHTGSDIDLAVEAEELTPTELLRIQLALDELELLYHIDLVRYETIKNPAFKEHIERVGLLFYQRQ